MYLCPSLTTGQITTTILAGIPARNVNKNVYVRVCRHRKVLSWLDPDRDHGDGVVEKSFTMTLHAQIWPVLRDYIH
jgi:hypothetical protein